MEHVWVWYRACLASKREGRLGVRLCEKLRMARLGQEPLHCQQLQHEQQSASTAKEAVLLCRIGHFRQTALLFFTRLETSLYYGWRPPLTTSFIEDWKKRHFFASTSSCLWLKNLCPETTLGFFGRWSRFNRSQCRSSYATKCLTNVGDVEEVQVERPKRTTRKLALQR